MYMAAELVAEGGPSAPVWALLTTTVTLLVGVLAQQLSAKRTAKDAKIEAAKASENSEKAAKNTANISNGFASEVGTKLDRILNKQDALDKAFREHLEWHLDNQTQNGRNQ